VTFLFITGNQTKLDEVTRLLGGVAVSSRKLSLARPEGASLAEVARARVLDAHAQVLAPCFTESTELALEGIPTMSGAQFKKRLLERGEQALFSELGGRRGVARVAVAYTADGVDARVFEGEVSGELLREPRGDGGYGWDRAWLADGYRRTFGEMAANKAIVNMRHRPYLELGDLLRGRPEGGTFEAHITVIADGAAAIDRFCGFCDDAWIKAVLIELPEGKTRSQPMTASYHHGTLREALDQVFDIARRLAAADFDVTRVKLEAVGRNREIPETAEQAAADPGGYFEYHIKVLVEAGADRAPLAAACERHGAHLSRNARKIRDDGVAERFVTLRVYGVGRAEAEARFAALSDEVAALGHPLGQRIREYTVYDSDEGVDAGWLSR
jgi:non-canonical purine NTP pyrophosphatase (RdgB/HAM1 family)